MHPVIYQWGPFTIYSYGLMLAIAVIVCSFFMSRDAERLGMKPELVFDFIFWITVSGILGARLFFITLNWKFFLENPLEMIMIQKGGLAWQGGLTLGSLAAWLFIKQHKLHLLTTLDLASPYIALGQSIGRIGCFLNGCCFGKEVSWGIYFSVHEAHLHPTQLYCSFGLLIIFFLLKKYQTKSPVPGKTFALYLILASILRFTVEFFRADHEIIFLGLSIYQLISLTFFVMGCVLFKKLRPYAGSLP